MLPSLNEPWKQTTLIAHLVKLIKCESNLLYVAPAGGPEDPPGSAEPRPSGWAARHK